MTISLGGCPSDEVDILVRSALVGPGRGCSTLRICSLVACTDECGEVLTRGCQSLCAVPGSPRGESRSSSAASVPAHAVVLEALGP
jgi:hypothetical protein